MDDVTVRWQRAAGAWQGAEPAAAEVRSWERVVGDARVALRCDGHRWAVTRDGDVVLFGELPPGGEMRCAGLLAIGVACGDDDVMRRDK
jgi:hypothetical protein